MTLLCPPSPRGPSLLEFVWATWMRVQEFQEAVETAEGSLCAIEAEQAKRESKS